MLKKFNRLLALAAALFMGLGASAEAPVTQDTHRRTAAPTVGGDQNAIIERATRRRTLMQARKAAAERARPAREAAKAARAAGGSKAALAKAGLKAPNLQGLTPPVGAELMDPLGVPDFMGGVIPNYANTIPLAKFVHTLPGLGSGQANDLGNYIPVGVPDRGTFAGSDFYEIDLIDYTQQLHSGLPKPTRLRGYIQHGAAGVNTVSGGASNYLGPVLVAKRDRPVRIKFNNLLGFGTTGNLPLPVDTSLMGSGSGPGATTFTQNRAELHLHGGLSPWISDGTPHQWITPKDDPTTNKKGVSFRHVPDMGAVLGGNLNDANDGAATYFYTNQQSGRFMFYHDHSFGLTRLNVYMGEAAGYLIVDPVETKLINAGIIPSQGATLPIAADPWDATSGANSLLNGNSVYTYGVPLIFQDKTFVPDWASMTAQDPTWDIYNWGQPGDLWFPHVYMPNQNPDDPSGANAMGRWDYGPWFWPPVPVADAANSIPTAHGPIPGTGNPADPKNGGFSYPGTPNPSLTPEAFMDTPVVNGAAYPKITVKPQAYRFRMLNAADDRPFSFAFYKADPAALTEVKMVEASPSVATAAAAFFATKYGVPATDPSLPVWPRDGRAGGVVDYSTIGPDIIQIGNESGFLPAPVVFRSQPTTYNYNRRDIVVLDVDKHALWLAPAERADVIVDFSGFQGQTLILYNDMLAPVPAFDVRYDYFTGPDADQTSTGGAPGATPGFGSNTRTLMQFVVTNDAPAAFDITALQAAFVTTPSSEGAFKASQHPPIVPQTFYNSAMNQTVLKDTYVRIQDYQKAYNRTENGDLVTMPLQPKAIQELFELDYGRMNATLGIELPFTNFNNQTTIPLGYSEPATEILTDGSTQLWKITHNGVDTHPVHFHLYDVQIVNRVGWDGAVRFPEANELGWKETVRMKPLEDIVVAFRPISPRLPFTLGNSLRSIDPTKDAIARVSVTDLGAGAPNQGNLGNQILVSNSNGVLGATPALDTAGAGYDYGWEYVWHCHILGHEENDFMRAVVLNVATSVPTAAAGLTATINGVAANRADLVWTDNATNETGFSIQRSPYGLGTFVEVGTAVPDSRSFSDYSLTPSTAYDYQVVAYNQAGNASASNIAFVNAPASIQVSGAVNTLSGPLAGVTVTFSNGGYGGITDAAGLYAVTVPNGWAGTATPSLAGYTFAPALITFGALATNQTAQNFTAAAFATVTGNVTLNGAPLVGATITPSTGAAATVTDASGNYTLTFTTLPWSGTVTATSGTLVFMPAVSATLSLTAAGQNVTQNFAAATATVSGTITYNAAPLAGVLVTYTGGTTTTAVDGTYAFTVNSGWTGTATPTKVGYLFTAASTTYTNLTASTVTNYTAAAAVEINGTVYVPGVPIIPIAGVTVTFSNGGGSVITNASGNYSALVPYGWSGTSTFSLAGWTFAPAVRNYTNVTTLQSGQNSRGTAVVVLSGNLTNNGAAQAGWTVTFSNGGGTATTDALGNYTRTLNAGWTGTVSITRTGYTFNPTTYSFANLLTNQANLNFTVSGVAITGTVYFWNGVLNPRPGVTVSLNTGQTTTTDASGNFSLTVPLGWSGILTYSGLTYTYAPATRTFANVLAPRAGMNSRTNL